ncbi:hypothetical protein [Streptomyces sp. NPDC102360]|uniref:hypothetical protein n=1 Tax=Streptomyces sp. NPDC102360 TaxID=3366160 RepID=UPI00380EC58E
MTTAPYGGKSRPISALATHRLPLDTTRDCFTWLTSGPDPLSLDCRAWPGLPNRAIPLDELRNRLLRRQCPHRTRDAAWAQLVRNSRCRGASWALACTGMALPALARLVARLEARYPGDPYDIQAEVVSGFLKALAAIDVERPHILVRLRWAAYRAGFAALREALDAPTPLPPGFWSAPPTPPWGHPDLVLAKAVRASVLTRTEADLIGSTRLDSDPLTDWADRSGMTASAAYKVRQRAEHRLVAFLRDPDCGTDSAHRTTTAPTSDCGPRAVSRSDHHRAPSPHPASRRATVDHARAERPRAHAHEPLPECPLSKTGPNRGLLT